ncbi:hypothetical protein IE81DRAFT_287997 [Ceraceosorus guamensis]|uniref:Uncharacterized protein n=1 Tax=Ceraceosorus guamensis TaxID=1522189 RepID=A0A316W2N1_9BASI|nr:hypothetical protein IE81DRAFT_287997 [Ceraceosorus guamensis]PWN43949.1 hypothetical protein IE81DRAFT_287997 [Ceraceosorus guamensis]
MPNNPVDEDQKLLRQENGASPPSPADGDADLSLTPSTGIVSDTVSLGISSSLSSASKPQTRLEMFPPLMLLKESSLDELKSNAVGPRKPPGGFLAKLPPMGSMISTVVDFIIGMEGSAFAAGIFRLELLRDFAQIMALQLHFDVSPSTGGAEKWSARWIILHFIPSILALDFVSILGKALILLLIWIIVVAALLIKFWRMTRAPNPNRTIEGFVSQPWLFTSPSMGTKLVNILTVFILTTLYIPLSKLAVDTISWSSDFWPVPNPYANGDNVGDLAPLGPASRFRDPMDFCWTTTMAKDEFNFAWLAVPIAVLTVIIYTLWYPYAMAKTIRPLLPRVSDFNELGVPRSEDEKEVEYLRLLERDRSPLNFMYKAYRRRWGFYKPLYILCFKLSNILVIGIVTKDNCLFRSMPGRTMLVVQQSTLIVLWSVLFAIHLYVVPFNDRISNRSELVSRAGYVLTAVVGLLVALQVQGSTVYRSTILYLIQALTYAGNIYFSLAGTGWMEHLVKRAQSRIDFSIDIFSPALDLDKHVKRRIWQETLSTLLLCARPYHMRPGKVVAFSIADDWPPYMLWFEGSPAERHVENLKILKAIGSDTYREQVDLLRNGENAARLTAVMDAIQSRLAGPDAYWRPTQPPFPVGVSSWFGKAFLVPFPPTLVMRYDQVQGDETVQLSTLGELELFVSQNEDPEVLSRRWVRTALRALDGQLVQAPHTEVVQIGGRLASSESFLQRRRSRVRAALGLGPRQGSGEFTLACPTSYETGTLRIARRELGWQGGPHDFASGFEVTVTYAEGTRQDPEGLTRVRKALTVDGTTAFGLHDDFRLTSDLVRFLRANEHIVHARRDNVERNLQQYRDGYATEAIRKRETLDYAFLTDVFDAPTLDRVQLRQTLRMVTRNPSVQHLPRQYRAAMTLLHERLMHVNQSPVHKWWWLFWDDLWRQNGRDYSQLRRHRRALCPHYPSSIAYQPVPRAELERFLDQRGLWQCQGARGVINRGLLNRLYFYLNMIVFARTRSWIKTHTMKDQSNPFADPPLLPANATSGRIARHHSDAAVRVALGTIRAYGRVEVEEHDINTIDSSLDPMSRFTGGGTNHDGSNIIERPAWPWAEQRLGGRPLLTRSERIWDRVMEWLALQPYKVNAHLRTLYLYLDLVDGPKGSRYELPGTHQESAFAEQVAEESPRTYPKIEQTAEEIALDRLSRPI